MPKYLYKEIVYEKSELDIIKYYFPISLHVYLCRSTTISFKSDQHSSLTLMSGIKKMRLHQP